MGNVIMKAQQITYGASNVEAALDALKVPELIELDKRMAAIDEWKANVHEVTFTGSDLTIENALALPARSLITSINAIQDLHGYDKPWAGGAGKNKWPFGDFNGTYSNVPFSLAAGTYTASKTNPDVNCGLRFYYADDTSIAFTFFTSETFTLTADVVKINYSSADATTENFMIESGTTATSFAPYSNVCPISGRTAVGIVDEGKNLADVELGSYGTNGSKVSTSDRVRTKTIMYLKKGTYTISATTKASGQTPVINYAFWASADTSGSNTRLYDSAWLSSPYTLTLTEDKYVSLIFKYSSGNSITLSDLSIQLEYGDTATAYTPYVTPTNATIQLGTTVYGADINWDTGVMTVKTVCPDLGGLTWTADATGVANKNRFYADLSPLAVVADSVNLTSISSQYTLLAPGGTYSANADGYTIIAASKIYIYDESLSSATAADFKTAMSGVQVEYTLATPTTIQLTPTQLEMLKGYNRVSIDNGSIELGYIAKLT